jgi:hypothetical protein
LNERPSIAGIAQRLLSQWKYSHATCVGLERLLASIERGHLDFGFVRLFHIPCSEPYIAAIRGRFVFAAANYRCGDEH